MAFVIDLFHQVVYEYDRHTVVADYTDQWPNIMCTTLKADG